MRVEREWLRTVVFGRKEARQFTQDSPILPEVWLVGGGQYCLDRHRRIDLLLTPHRAHTPGPGQRAPTAARIEPRQGSAEAPADARRRNRGWQRAGHHPPGVDARRQPVDRGRVFDA